MLKRFFWYLLSPLLLLVFDQGQALAADTEILLELPVANSNLYFGSAPDADDPALSPAMIGSKPTDFGDILVENADHSFTIHSSIGGAALVTQQPITKVGNYQITSSAILDDGSGSYDILAVGRGYQNSVDIYRVGKKSLSYMGRLAGGAGMGYGFSLISVPNPQGNPYLVIGAPFSANEQGAIYVYIYESASDFYKLHKTESGAAIGERFGYSMAAIGANYSISPDIDGIVVGSPFADAGQIANTGKVTFVRASASSSGHISSVYSSDAGAELGTSIASGRDIDGVGGNDVFAGAPGTNGGDGATYFITVDPNLIPALQYVQYGTQPNAALGQAVDMTRIWGAAWHGPGNQGPAHDVWPGHTVTYQANSVSSTLGWPYPMNMSGTDVPWITHFGTQCGKNVKRANLFHNQVDAVLVYCDGKVQLRASAGVYPLPSRKSGPTLSFEQASSLDPFSGHLKIDGVKVGETANLWVSVNMDRPLDLKNPEPWYDTRPTGKKEVLGKIHLDTTMTKIRTVAATMNQATQQPEINFGFLHIEAPHGPFGPAGSDIIQAKASDGTQQNFVLQAAVCKDPSVSNGPRCTATNALVVLRAPQRR